MGLFSKNPEAHRNDATSPKAASEEDEAVKLHSAPSSRPERPPDETEAAFVSESQSPYDASTHGRKSKEQSRPPLPTLNSTFHSSDRPPTSSEPLALGEDRLWR